MIMARKVIAHGVGSKEVPTYITVYTGRHAPTPELVMVTTKRGNTVENMGSFPWQKMHGIRVAYMKYDAYKQTTIYDDNQVTMMSTGAWSVEVEPPG